MRSMRSLWFLALAACSYTRPGDLGPDTDGPTSSDTPTGDAMPLGDAVRAIDLVDGQVSGGPHVDFPLLVSMTETYLRDLANGGDVTRADGFDIYFSADQAGTARLAHEVERYDPAKGAVVAWVKVPSLTAATVIYLHYGSDTITTSQQDTAAVWSTGYVAVLHLDDAADATGNATQVSMQTTSAIETPMDRGHTFDGSDDRIIVSSPTIDDIFATGGTAEGWFFALGFGENGFGRIWDKGNQSGWSLSLDDANATKTLTFVHGDSIDFAEWQGPSDAVTLNVWHHIAVVYDRGSDANDPILYIDGAPTGVIQARAPIGPMDSDAAAQLMAGNRGAGDRTFNGTFDELRMSNVVRSPEWLATEFVNQVAPSAFYAVSEPL